MFNRHNVSFRALASTGSLGTANNKLAPGAAPENPPPTGTDDQDFANNAKGQAETFDNTVYLDPDLEAERLAMKAIAARSIVRWVFIGAGATDNFSDADNWWDDVAKARAVPSVAGTGALIPLGQRCVFDLTDGLCPDLATFRIDGEFEIDTSANRTITFNFIFGDHTGSFVCGTELSPVPSNITIRFSPYDCETDMDIVADPMMLGRGLAIFDGTISIHGDAKQEWMRATSGLTQGSNIFTGDRAATNWQIGDVIRFTGTQFAGYQGNGWEDWKSEEVQITGINNANPDQPVITFSPALANDHLSCYRRASLTCHVLNLSRNVIFDPPDAQTPEVWQRPHNMFKGEGGIDIRHVWVRRYGRTNHEEPLANNGIEYPVGSTQWNGEPWNAPTFLQGSFGQINYTGASGSIRIGNTFVTSSGGAGVVVTTNNGTLYIEQYDTQSGPLSNGDTITFSNGTTATATTDGLKYVLSPRHNFDGRYPMHAHRCGHKNPNTPAVTFRGIVVTDSHAWAFVHHDSHADFLWCISTDHRSAGFAAEGGGSFGNWLWCVADGCKESWEAYDEADTKNGGLSRGAFGHGFWLNSRLIHMQFCVASNNQCGALWTSRIASAQQTSPYPSNTDKPELFYELGDNPEISVNKAFARIEGFKTNEFYCCVFGVAVAKKQPLQHHFGVSYLDGATIWECEVGVAFQYTGAYTTNNFLVIGFDPSNRNGVPPYQPSRGFSIFRQAVSIVVRDCTVEGMSTGIKYTLNGGTNFLNNLGHRVVNFTAVAVDEKYEASGIGGGVLDLENQPWDNFSDGLIDAAYMTSAQEGPGTAGSITVNWSDFEDETVWDGSNDFLILGTFTDSLGLQNMVLAVRNDGTLTDLQSERPSGQVGKEAGFLVLMTKAMMEAQLNEYGYYTRTNGERVLLIHHSVQDRGSGEFTDNLLTPAALRIDADYLASLNVTNNGPIEGLFGGAFDTYTPAGTPGLT